METKLFEEIIGKSEEDISHCVFVSIKKLKRQRRLTQSEEDILRPHNPKHRVVDNKKSVLEEDEIESTFERIKIQQKGGEEFSEEEKVFSEADDNLSVEEWREISQKLHPNKFNKHKYYKQSTPTH